MPEAPVVVTALERLRIGDAWVVRRIRFAEVGKERVAAEVVESY